ncbi:MAG: cytochrome c family protein [Sedimentisphaerales bacterium]|nr:cytochrome c family protein [Sedimentisphaerales bacterium]
MRATLIICIFGAGIAAGAGWAAEPNLTGCNEKAAAACETIAVFVTGNQLGELRPCGCSGGQLGGFERRGALLDAVSPEQRFVLDTGNLIKRQTEQSLIKFEIILQAFTMLGYDVVSLTKQDAAIAARMGLIGNVPFKLIAAQISAEANLPQVISKQMKLGNTPITVMVAAAADESSVQQAANELAVVSNETAIKIVIFEGDEQAARQHLAELENAHVVIVQTDADEPKVLKKTDKGAMLISAGRLGKYVGRLDVRRSKMSGGFEFAYTSLAVDANLPQSPAFIELYKSYQAIVKNQKLLEKYPKYVLADDSQYVGSTACGIKGCHDYEYGQWSTKRHAHAMETLVKVGSDADPECVICHVVGMEYKSGFITAKKTPELTDVGCENCHGPGSKHLVTAGKAKTTAPQSKCLDCHTVENSANYAGHEKEYEKKIVHWREPNAPKSVK